MKCPSLFQNDLGYFMNERGKQACEALLFSLCFCFLKPTIYGAKILASEISTQKSDEETKSAAWVTESVELRSVGSTILLAFQ
jgi:hypothetical protein